MGWSGSRAITASRDDERLWNPGNYRDPQATWYQKNWWSTNVWAWIYKNETKVALKMTKASFLACAGHSNNKLYCGSPGTGATLKTSGAGCTFEIDIRVIDSAGVRLSYKKAIATCSVEAIDSYNCVNKSTGVLGTTSDQFGKTSFGDPAYGWEGAKRWHEIPFTIDSNISPSVPPGGQMILTVNPIKWTTNSNEALLVMLGDSGDFTSEMQPEDEDYIYICLQKEGDAEKKWYKERKAFMRTSKGWEELKEI